MDENQAVVELGQETQPEQPITKKAKKEKVKKEKAKKSFGKRILSWFLLIFFLLIVIGAAFIYFYLGNSTERVRVDVEDDFDMEYMMERIGDGYDDGRLEAFIEEGEINYLIQENSDAFSSLELPMGIEVKSVLFSTKKESLYVFLEGGFLDTYLRVKLDVDADDDLIMVQVDDLKLGKWDLPLPTDFIMGMIEMPDMYYDGVEVPKMIEMDKIKFSKDEVEFSMELDDSYTEELVDILREGFLENRARDYYQVAIGEDQAFLSDYWSVVMDGYDADELVVDMVSNNRSRIMMLVFLEEEQAEYFLKKIKRDVDLLDDDFIDVAMNERTKKYEFVSREIGYE